MNIDIEISVLTYNIRSCRGLDGIVSHHRIADVIADLDPDIIALQEVDVGLERSDLVDQAESIAAALSMSYHFHPSFWWQEGEYGNVIMSKHSLKLIRAKALPGIEHGRRIEKRGAIWAKIVIRGMELQVFNTHLGLKRRERMVQAEALCGPDWLDDPQCKKPVIVCGDLNSGPLSRVYRMFHDRLFDAQRSGEAGVPRSTWPARFPLSRIDHIFHSGDIEVRESRVVRNDRTRIASDHLPLFVKLRLSGTHPGGRT